MTMDEHPPLAEVRGRIEKELASYKKSDEMTLEIAKASSEAALVIGELHETPTLEKLRSASATLRSIGADLVALELQFIRRRAFTSQMHALVVGADQTGFSPEEKSAMAALEADIRKMDDWEQKLTSLQGKLSASWGTLESALTTAYAELREERQSAFQNRMQVLGAVITILVALFTIVSTLKSLGWI